MLHAVPKAEFLDINEQSYSYIQKLDWTNYQNEVQPMTSEHEFIIGALLNHSPDTALELRTPSDIFEIKSKGGHYKTCAQKLLFLQRCHGLHHKVISVFIQEVVGDLWEVWDQCVWFE